MPVFKFKSNARPSLFAYPPKIKPPTQTAPTKVHTAVLSTTKKKEQRDKKKEDEEKKKAMEVDQKEPKDVEMKDVEMKEEEAKKKEEEKKEPEPAFEIKSNPTRITPAQRKYLSFDVDERYKPISDAGSSGIVMLLDTQPDKPEELVKEAATPTGKIAVFPSHCDSRRSSG